MKICVYTDVHFCEFSSIVRSYGQRYSCRLHNLLMSVNWAEKEAINQQCDQIICLGDFFDRPDLNSRELTALQEINWANIPHSFLVGNHEASSKSLEYNSVSALKSLGFNIITEPELIVDTTCKILLLPYITEDSRQDLINYWLNVQETSCKRIIMSHNDISGIQYGMVESREGFTLEDIQNNCDLFLNGHIHNMSCFNNVFNIGNLTGQNFSEDAFQYQHGLYILDTDKNSLEFIENPFALNFYKIDCTDIKNISKLQEIKENSVISIKCFDSDKQQIIAAMQSVSSKIAESRITSVAAVSTLNEETMVDLSIDHLTKFCEFCRSKIDNSDILEDELKEVCK